MEYEEALKVITGMARRVQIMEKQLHDFYWDIDQYIANMMKQEIEKQQAFEKQQTEKAKVKVNDTVEKKVVN